MLALDGSDPSHIGRYRLVGRLGEGGMGRVYLARSPGGRPAAVKVINDHLGHHIGDRFINAFVELLARSVDVSSIIARFGGDEFIVVPSAPMEIEAAEAFAQRLQYRLHTQVVIEGRLAEDGQVASAVWLGGSLLCERLALVPVQVVGVWDALRLPALGDSLFGDELSSYFVVTGRSLAGTLHLLNGKAIELNPPLYFLLAWASEKLAGESPRSARVVELRFFGGLDAGECAEAMEISLTTVEREWRFGRAWLQSAMAG